MPDFWSNRNELAEVQTGAISVNLVWALWEGNTKSPPCSGSEQEYDGHCFVIDQSRDAEIRAYTDLGVVVTGIVYGVPGWARVGNTGCSPAIAGFDMFCSPDNPDDYARFAGMIAQRYNGENGHGRVADFVIHNEINTNIWFDIGCGQGVPCDQALWIQTYAENYAAAYDLIKSHQSEAKVLLSFEHHYDYEYDQPAADFTVISVKTFITEFDAQIGNRKWQVAYHPYAPDLWKTEFSALDLPRVTYGNIGVILGWLRAAFPNKPHAWEVQLTESGLNSGPPSNEAAQAAAMCTSLRNILGTPGITSYIYHRMQDHPADGDWKIGMRRADGSAKPSWTVWAMANRIDLDPPQLDCGFEHLPYTLLTSSVRDEFVDIHWTSSRLPPADFAAEESWYLLREPEAGTVLLFECYEETLAGDTTFLTEDVGCEGMENMGPVGYIWTTQIPNSVALYRCRGPWNQDNFVSEDSNCNGEDILGLLGYALPAP
ncbi:MAG: hypothetical protein JRF33_23130 [Deltaproteobacteria bacterium]|nr:hypothetical protein [Deltaproteobacteria bacterium]